MEVDEEGDEQETNRPPLSGVCFANFGLAGIWGGRCRGETLGDQKLDVEGQKR